jgi:hypothetical protein
MRNRTETEAGPAFFTTEVRMGAAFHAAPMQKNGLFHSDICHPQLALAAGTGISFPKASEQC